MKISLVLLTLGCLNLYAKGFSQSVTFSGENIPLEKVLSSVRKQTGYVFMYTKQGLASAKPVTIRVENLPLEKFLKEVFRNQPLEYSITGKSIFISPKTFPRNSTAEPGIILFADSSIDVRGRLVNEKGDPVAGTSISVKGRGVAGTTNSNGEFELKNLKRDAILIFSATNIEEMEIKLNGRTYLLLSAKTRVSKLDEVQIIAYGTSTQRYNVGSVTKVSGEDIQRQPVSNPLAALAGRVPGLVVDQTTGMPGGAIKIQIRGQNTLRPTDGGLMPYDNPLFIVDGVPLASNNNNLNVLGSIFSPGSNLLYGNAYGGISPFAYLDPNSIETIEVLRDADATSIYGSRGANGVILITTKKANKDKLGFTTNIYTGQSRATRTADMLDTRQYVMLRKEAFANSNVTPDLTNAFDILIFDTTKYTDWKKQFLGNTATTLDVSTSMSGGNANTGFLLGASFHRETYIFAKGFSDQRFSVNSSINHTSSDKKFSLRFSTSFSYGSNNSSSANGALNSFSLLPHHPDLLDEYGNIVWAYKGFSLDANPMQFLKQKYRIRNKMLNSNLTISYQLLDHLTLRTSLGYSSFNTDEFASFPRAARNPYHNIDPSGQADFAKRENSSWIIEPQLEYNRMMGKGKLNLLAGGTLQRQSGAILSISGDKYNSDDMLESLLAAGTREVKESSATLYKYASLFGRIGYTWDKKYIISLTGRSDASSRFGPGKRIGRFGSLAGGWIFTEEHFLKNNAVALSYGKLRASYGTTGSDNIGDYQFTSYWAPYNPAYDGIPGYKPVNLFMPDYSWASNKKLDLGIELGFLKDRVILSLDWYRNRCGNQLIAYALPIQTGFNNVTQNFPAVVENKGWEFQISSTNISNNKFKWISAFNISIPRNKLLAFPDIESSSYYATYKVGYSLSTIPLFAFKGVDPQTGLFSFQTKNNNSGDPDYGLDMTEQINLDPKFYGGLRNVLTWSGFELDLFFQFKKQMGRSPLAVLYSSNIGGPSTHSYPTAILERWQKPGDNSRIQKLTINSPEADIAGSAFMNSTGAFSDASFIRLKTASIAWSMQQKTLKQFRIPACRISLTTQNLFTISNYEGHDPETQSYYGIPPLSTWVASLQLTL